MLIHPPSKLMNLNIGPIDWVSRLMSCVESKNIHQTRSLIPLWMGFGLEFCQFHLDSSSKVWWFVACSLDETWSAFVLCCLLFRKNLGGNGANRVTPDPHKTSCLHVSTVYFVSNSNNTLTLCHSLFSLSNLNAWLRVRYEGHCWWFGLTTGEVEEFSLPTFF